MYKEGVVVHKDNNLAMGCFKQAAKKGNSNALVNLGLMKINKELNGEYFDDQEETDDERFNPQECLVMAAKKGNERARDILGSKMARSVLEQIAQA